MKKISLRSKQATVAFDILTKTPKHTELSAECMKALAAMENQKGSKLTYKEQAIVIEEVIKHSSLQLFNK